MQDTFQEAISVQQLPLALIPVQLLVLDGAWSTPLVELIGAAALCLRMFALDNMVLRVFAAVALYFVMAAVLLTAFLVTLLQWCSWCSTSHLL